MPQSAARRTDLLVLRRDLPPQKKKPALWLKIALAALAVAVGAALSLFAWHNRAIAPETVALTRGTVEITYAVDGLVARREQVYTAPAAGQVRRLAADGQRVRVGSPIARIVAGGAPAPVPATPVAPSSAPAGDEAVRRELDNLTAAIYAKASAINTAKANGDAAAAASLQAELDQISVRQQALTLQLKGTPPPPAVKPPEQTTTGPSLAEIAATASGVVVYQTDGLESKLDLAHQSEWKPGLVRSLTAEPRETLETVGKGDPVLKVVDNLTISLLAVVPEAALSRLNDAGAVTVRIAGRESAVAANISRQVSESGEVLLVLTAPAFPEDLIHQRRFRATIVMGGYDGLIVPRTAVDVREGLQGVWVQDGATSRFVPVRVLGGNDELLALEAYLQVGVRVLRNAPTGMR